MMKRLLKTIVILLVGILLFAAVVLIQPFFFPQGIVLWYQKFQLPESPIQKIVFTSHLNGEGNLIRRQEDASLMGSSESPSDGNDTEAPDEEFRLETEESDLLTELVGVLKESQRVGFHACIHTATLDLTFESGTTITLELLPGHDEEHYEFRADKPFRIDRQRFLAWAETVGIPRERVMPNWLDGAAPETDGMEAPE